MLNQIPSSRTKDDSAALPLADKMLSSFRGRATESDNCGFTFNCYLLPLHSLNVALVGNLKMSSFNVDFLGDFLSDDEAKSYFEDFTVYAYTPLKFNYGGRIITTKRKCCAFSDGGISYPFSNQNIESAPWTPALKKLKEVVEKTYNCRFNFALLNYYEDGEAYISPHRDDENCYEPDSNILTVSLGAQRKMTFTRKGFPSKHFELCNGSALLMKPPTNDYWHRTIPKQPASLPHISVTFHHMISRDESAMMFYYAPRNASSSAPSHPTISYSDAQEPDLCIIEDETPRKKRKISEDNFVFQESIYHQTMKKINDLDLNFDVQKVDLTDKLFLMCSQFREGLKIHLRSFYSDESGVLKPTKIGLAFDLKTWYEIHTNFNNFSLLYPSTSFIANNCVSILSFYEKMVFKSLYRTGDTITLNVNQFDVFKDSMYEFTEKIIHYVFNSYLLNHFEKYVDVNEKCSYSDEKLLAFLITAIEDNVSKICLKRYICKGCLFDNLSQYKHDCQTLTRQEIFQTFPRHILLTIDCREVVDVFKHHSSSVSKSFLSMINFATLSKKIFE